MSPIRCFKVRDLQFFGKEKSFFLGHWPIIGIFWLFCKTNNSNTALSTFSYGKPRNFLVLGARSSNAWKNFSLFLIQVEMVFLGTPNLSADSLFVMPFSMCDKMSHFPSKFSYSAYVWQTFLFWRHDTDNWEQKTDLFFIYGRNFCFDSNSNLFGNSKMKLEYVNVRDRERKWFKGPEIGLI